MEKTLREAVGRRTGIKFHEHEVNVTEFKGAVIHHLKKPNTYTDSIKFINAGGVLAVTGDYGNWIFCREFHPDPKGGVSDGYWEEKLQIASTQNPHEFDKERTRIEIEVMLNGGIKDYGWKGDKAEEMKEYFEECLDRIDDELDYKQYAYNNYPSFCDHEIVIFCKKTKYWLNAVFDGFDEICRRMKEKIIQSHP